MGLNPNQTEDQTQVNLDEIEPETTGASETGGEDVECPDSPSGNHEFDTNEGDDDAETCVYCGVAKDE